MKTLNRRELVILYVCAAVIGVYGIFMLAVRPLIERGEAIGGQIEAAERRLAKNVQTAQQAADVDAEYQRLVSILGTEGSEGAEGSSMVSKLEAAARQADVQIANMQPQRTVSKEILKAFPVEIVIDGKWPNIVKFLYLVQSDPNLFNVDRLSLEKYSDTTASLRGNFVLSRTRVVQ